MNDTFWTPCIQIAYIKSSKVNIKGSSDHAVIITYCISKITSAGNFKYNDAKQKILKEISIFQKRPKSDESPP